MSFVIALLARVCCGVAGLARSVASGAESVFPQRARPGLDSGAAPSMAALATDPAPLALSMGVVNGIGACRDYTYLCLSVLW